MAAQRRDEEEFKIKCETQHKINEYTIEIKNLAPRISELIGVAQEMHMNNIPLGKIVQRRGFYEPEFEAEGIYHKLGFYTRGGCIPSTLAIIGGGCDGYDMQVDGEGEICVNPLLKRVGTWGEAQATNDFFDKCRRFLAEFDEFETKVYEYVDSL